VTHTQAVNRPRTLGTTGLAVSPIGLGLAALGRPGYINLGRDQDLGDDRGVAAIEARAHEALDEAWRLGVRYLDAARSYGRAEAFLATWLAARGVAPSEVTLGSKWGYTYTADWRVDAEAHEVMDHGFAAFDRQWPESRALLGAHLDLYQIHSLTLASPALDDREPLERAAGPALAEARAAGVGVIVKEALANGRLTEPDTDTDFADRRAALRAEARRLGTTPDALALAAALARPWADVVLSGAATAAQLRSNLRALAVVWGGEAEAALAGLAEDSGAYWQRRQRLAWS